MIWWFAANKLVLNLDNNVMESITEASHSTLCTGYKERCGKGGKYKISCFTN